MRAVCSWWMVPLLSLTAAGAEAPRKPPPANSVQRDGLIAARERISPPARPLVYRPPRVGLPKVTAACGTRDQGVDRLELSVLAPEHVGWTSLAGPVLVWHRTGPVSWPLEATLVVPGRVEPVLQIRLEAQGNWHRLDLAHHGIELEPGVTYQWAVAAIVDPRRRSQDLVAAGAIQRVTLAEEVAASLALCAERDRILASAGHGLWYDAVSELAGQLERSPDDSELLQWRVSLCQQAGLRELAARELAKSTR